MGEPIKAVFDTQVFLRALINPKSICAKITPNQWRNIYKLYTCEEMIAELVDVLGREPIRKRFPQITDQLVEIMLQMIHDEAHLVELDRPIDQVCRDPKDDIFLACAKQAQVDYLVSEDKDLLVLEAYEDVRIVNVLDFLYALQTHQHDVQEPENDSE